MATDRSADVRIRNNSGPGGYNSDPIQPPSRSGGGGGGGPSTPPAPPPPPPIPGDISFIQKGSPTKIANRDTFTLADEVDESQSIAKLLFQDLSAHELVSIVRQDTVDGVNPYYQTISNLSDIRRDFDPSLLITPQRANESFFDIFPINLDEKIPDDIYLEDNNLSNFIYIANNGDLVIELTNITEDEEIEVQIDINGTIYEVEEI